MTEEKDKGHPVRAEILGDTMPKSKAHSSPGRPWQSLRISGIYGHLLLGVAFQSLPLPDSSLSPPCAPFPPLWAEAGKTKLLHSTGPVLIPTVLISSRGNSLLLCTTQSTDPSIQLSKQNWEENLVCF